MCAAFLHIGETELLLFARRIVECVFFFIKCILVVCPAVLLNLGAIKFNSRQHIVYRLTAKKDEKIYQQLRLGVRVCIICVANWNVVILFRIGKTIPKLACCFTFFSLFLQQLCVLDEYIRFDGQIIKVIMIFVYPFPNFQRLWLHYGVNYCTNEMNRGRKGSILVFVWWCSYLTNNCGANLIWSVCYSLELVLMCGCVSVHCAAHKFTVALQISVCDLL